jgi:hypothetical protein
MNLTDGFRVEPGTFVVKVISSNSSHGRISQLHALDGLRDSSRFISIERLWFAGINIAEVASSRARATSDKKCRFTIFPTFENIGASSFLADSVQTFTNYERPEG